MTRIDINLTGYEESYDLEKITRDKIYGSKIVEYFTKDGKKCEVKLFNNETQQIINSGMISNSKIDNEFNSKKLSNLLEDWYSPPGTTLNLPVTATYDDILSMNFTSLYCMSKDHFSDLVNTIKNGIYKIKVIIRKQQDAIIIRNDEHFFLLIGKNVDIHYIESDSIISIDEEETDGEDEEDEDEISFRMF